MRAQARAHKVPLDRVDLEALDRFLMSDRSPPESMTLSYLDGFLTGIVVGPEWVLPSEWLPLVFGGDAPEFADETEARAVFGAIMGRYSEIFRQIEDCSLNPVFWAARDGTLIAADWAEGFLQAVMLRADAWERLFRSERHGWLMIPILMHCCDSDGKSLLGLSPEDDNRLKGEAVEFIPACVIAINDYWHENKSGPDALPFAALPFSRAGRKAGRNDPCPCGSGKKFKKCCGKGV